MAQPEHYTSFKIHAFAFATDSPALSLLQNASPMVESAESINMCNALSIQGASLGTCNSQLKQANEAIHEFRTQERQSTLNVLLPLMPVTVLQTTLLFQCPFLTDAKEFLLHCSLYFAHHEHSFPSYKAKLVFITSLLTGKALSWALAA